MKIGHELQEPETFWADGSGQMGMTAAEVLVNIVGCARGYDLEIAQSDQWHDQEWRNARINHCQAQRREWERAMRLAEAVPDLLAACKDLVDDITISGAVDALGREMAESQTMLNARAAIAKAEGPTVRSR